MGRGAVFGAIALAFALADCARGPVVLYEGPPRDRSEIAVLRRSSGADIRVLRIDDYDTGGFEWHLVPGQHRIWVELKQYGTAPNVRFSAFTWCAMDFAADAGGAYRVISENDQRRSAVDTALTLGARIVDASDRLVGVLSDCYDRRPPFAKP